MSDNQPNQTHDKKPEDVTISEGLGKLYEAAELIPEDEIDRLAEEAKAAARQSQQEHDAKREHTAPADKSK